MVVDGDIPHREMLIGIIEGLLGTVNSPLLMKTKNAVQHAEDHVLDSCERVPCLVGSPSELALVGFVGEMMGTAEALWVPSGGPMGNGTPCDVGSGSPTNVAVCT